MKTEKNEKTVIAIEENNGGTFLEVEKNADDSLWVKFGHDCVVRFEGEISLESIVAFIRGAESIRNVCR